MIWEKKPQDPVSLVEKNVNYYSICLFKKSDKVIGVHFYYFLCFQITAVVQLSGKSKVFFFVHSLPCGLCKFMLFKFAFIEAKNCSHKTESRKSPDLSKSNLI